MYNLLNTDKDFEVNNIDREFRFCVGELNVDKACSGKKKRTIKGYASTSQKDRSDDVITHEALEKAKDDLLQKGARTVFFNHDRNIPIGKVIATELDQKGLMVEVMISQAPDVDNYWIKIQEGVLNSLSIGGRLKKTRLERDEDGRIISMQVLEIKLFEVSVVGIPANPGADIFSAVEKCYSKERTMSKDAKVAEKFEKKEEELEKKEDIKEVEKEVKVEEVKKEEVKKEEVKKEEVTVELVKQIVADQMKTVNETVESLKKKVDEMPEWAKTLTSAVDNITKELTKVPTRKGVVDEIAEEEGDEEETPQKSLEDINNEDTVAFVKYIMDNEDEYEKMENGEQEKARNIYMQLMMKKELNKKR